MEVLAAAPGVLDVVSLALRLAENAQRLVNFWDHVKDAPTEATELQSELRVLDGLLRSIQFDDEHRPNGEGENLGLHCLLLCQGSFKRLEGLSKGWNRELSRDRIRRKWSCLRIALKEKQLSSYRCELERAKSTLTMYQCLRNGQRQDSLHQFMMNIVPTLHKDQLQQPPATQVVRLDISTPISQRFKKMHLGTRMYELRLSFGTICVRLVKESVVENCTQMGIVKYPSHMRIVATFLPKITSWRILECIFKQRNGSIGAGFRTFNLRPGWSPIFGYASRGDLQGVRRLIEDGLASPNDVDPDGWTVLHCAAAAHQVGMCQMLLALGAISDPVNKYQETPLLLATHSNGQNVECRPKNDESAGLDTLRVLIEQGKNDPMQSNDIGWTPVFYASKTSASKSLLWLMNQDEYELDFNYTTPRGLTAAALLVQREDLSATVFQPLLRNGIPVDAPCAEILHFRRFGIYKPSMIQYAVWSWYDKLLNSYERRFPYGHTQPEVPSPKAAVQTLLAHGADFHCDGSPERSILKGLLGNITQFDGEERPLGVMRDCMSTWLKLVQELGFNLKDYIRIEARKRKGKWYDMGAGIQMFVCFDEDNIPHIWTIFQGPREREKNLFVDRISKCANWKEWQFRYALPEPLHRLKTQKILEQSAEIIVVQKQCGCPEFGAHLKSCNGPIMERRSDTELSQPSSSTLTSSVIPSRERRIVSSILYYMISARYYRHEFTFYVFVLACFFGCSYFARFWIAGGVFLALKLFEDTISYWI